MAVTALYSAATGMHAMETRMDVIANNLANASTTAFKSQRVNFEDLFYEKRRQPGSLNSLGDRTSTGLFIGHGVRVSNTQLNMGNGSLEQTGRPLDVAITGPGFFRVRTFEGIGGGEAFTRSGSFIKNRDGDLVVATADGPLLEPTINLPEGTDPSSITIQTDGSITVQVDGEEQTVGQIQIFKFNNPHGLASAGANLFVETEASGAPRQGNPTDAGFGSLTQNYLEASNVDPVKELIELIRTQRTFELNSQTIRAADENLGTISQLRR